MTNVDSAADRPIGALVAVGAFHCGRRGFFVEFRSVTPRRVPVGEHQAVRRRPRTDSGLMPEIQCSLGRGA